MKYNPAHLDDLEMLQLIALSPIPELERSQSYSHCRMS